MTWVTPRKKGGHLFGGWTESWSHVILCGLCLVHGVGIVCPVLAEDDEVASHLSLKEASSDQVDPEGLSFSATIPLASPTETRTVRLRKAYGFMNDMDYEEAIENFQAVLSTNPEDKQAWMGISVIYAERYEVEKALEILERLMDRYPNDVAIKNNAAWVYATAGTHNISNGQRAVELGREALIHAPGSYHIWSTMSEAYYAIGAFEKALKAAEEAFRMAREAKAVPDNMREYKAQIQKNRKAIAALSLME